MGLDSHQVLHPLSTPEDKGSTNKYPFPSDNPRSAKNTGQDQILWRGQVDSHRHQTCGHQGAKLWRLNKSNEYTLCFQLSLYHHARFGHGSHNHTRNQQGCNTSREGHRQDPREQTRCRCTLACPYREGPQASPPMENSRVLGMSHLPARRSCPPAQEPILLLQAKPSRFSLSSFCSFLYLFFIFGGTVT